MKNNEFRTGIYVRFIKRLMDICLSLIALVILSPILFIIALLVKLKLGSPIFFKQERPGLNENKFILYKFRTMIDAENKVGEVLPDHKRLTNFGKMLRATSLDELPELINILKGDMSIVGPRPLLVEYLELYNDHQRKRHSVRPGLTGLAQISGRNAITWDQKFELDIVYVNSISFINDWRIIFLTFKKVILKEGINSDTDVTMHPFTGNEDNT